MIIDNIVVKGITCDSRKVKKSYAFVAVKGEKKDGNDFINEAIRKGASIIFTENDVALKDVAIKKVKNARQTLADLCNAFYDYPSEKLKVIGITGTNGKTTTSHLIYHILKSYGISTGLIGTLNIKINDREYKTKLTTPDTETLYAYLDKMAKEKVEVVVMEVSSHGLKNDRVWGIKYDIAVHTNIERDHLNFHKTFEDYLSSKKKLFDSLEDGKIAIINLDDDNSLRLLDKNHQVLVVSYGLSSKATITASSIDMDFETSFNFCLQRALTTISGIDIEAFEYPLKIKIIGKHNIYNTLAAATCGLLLDVPIGEIAKSLKSFKGVSRRMEIIYKEDYTVIDDFCHNPASYETVFESIQSMQYRNLYVVNAIRGSRGVDINYEIAQVIKQWYSILKIKDIIITSSTDYVGSSDIVEKEERDVFIQVLSRGNISFQYQDSLKESIKKMINILQKGDILLLLGAQGMNHGAQICLRMIKNKSYLENINAKSDFEAIIPRH